MKAQAPFPVLPQWHLGHYHSLASLGPEPGFFICLILGSIYQVILAIVLKFSVLLGVVFLVIFPGKIRWCEGALGSCLICAYWHCDVPELSSVAHEVKMKF